MMTTSAYPTRPPKLVVIFKEQTDICEIAINYPLTLSMYANVKR